MAIVGLAGSIVAEPRKLALREAPFAVSTSPRAAVGMMRRRMSGREPAGEQDC